MDVRLTVVINWLATWLCCFTGIAKPNPCALPPIIFCCVNANYLSFWARSKGPPGVTTGLIARIGLDKVKAFVLHTDIRATTPRSTDNALSNCVNLDQRITNSDRPPSNNNVKSEFYGLLVGNPFASLLITATSVTKSAPITLPAKLLPLRTWLWHQHLPQHAC